MRMGQGVRTGLGHGGITCVLQTQFSSSILKASRMSSCYSDEHFVFYCGSLYPNLVALIAQL